MRQVVPEWNLGGAHYTTIGVYSLTSSNELGASLPGEDDGATSGDDAGGDDDVVLVSAVSRLLSVDSNRS